MPEIVTLPASVHVSRVWGWRTNVRVALVGRDGTVEVHEMHNLVTSAGKDALANAFRGTVTDLKIKYLALGDGTSAPTASQTKLDAEKFRKQVTQQTLNPSGGAQHGVLKTTVYVSPGEATAFTLNEMGWFAGTAATGTQDSGVMVARCKWLPAGLAKTALQSVQIDRTDTWS